MSARQTVALPEDRPSWLETGRVPGLDGLRGLAVLLVLIGHTVAFQTNQPPQFITRLGEWGVDLFFAISGFIITLLLLRDYQQQRPQPLRAFYARRIIRILPPYALFLLFIFGGEQFGLHQIKPMERVGLLTFTVNLVPEGSSYTGHIWSLSLEEQFYLVWPFVLLMVGPRRGLWVAATIVAIMPLTRWLAWNYAPWIHPNYSTLTRIDGVMMGCVVALLASGLTGFQLPPMRSRGPLWFCYASAGLWLFRAWAEQTEGSHLIYHSGSAFFMAALVWIVISTRESWVTKLFSHRFLVFMGLISYSLYLWQQPFLYRHGNAWWNQFPVNWLIIFSLTFLSYLTLERPLQRWRARWRTGEDNSAAGKQSGFVQQGYGTASNRSARAAGVAARQEQRAHPLDVRQNRAVL